MGLYQYFSACPGGARRTVPPTAGSFPIRFASPGIFAASSPFLATRARKGGNPYPPPGTPRSSRRVGPAAAMRRSVGNETPIGIPPQPKPLLGDHWQIRTWGFACKGGFACKCPGREPIPLTNRSNQSWGNGWLLHRKYTHTKLRCEGQRAAGTGRSRAGGRKSSKTPTPIQAS